MNIRLVIGHEVLRYESVILPPFLCTKRETSLGNVRAGL